MAMNILFLDQFGTIGGGQRSLLELLPLVRQRGWRARVALPADATFAKAVRASGIPVDIIPCATYTPSKKRSADFARFGWEFPQMARAIAALAHSHRIGLLYVNGPRLLPAAALVARAASIPLVLQAHHRLLQPIAVRLAAESLRWSRARVIACCRFAAEPLRPYLASDRCRVVYNGVAAPSWTRRGSDFPKPWNIGVVGRVEPEKGQIVFVAAARILSAEFAACRFIVAGAPMFSGPDYLARVKEASRALPIEFHGWRDDIGAVFSRLDLLVVPSSDIDSTPRVVIEAFSAGIPVVAFPSGGIPEIVEDGRTGFLALAASPAALAERIRSVMLMDSEKLREVVAGAREAWRAKYTLDRYQEEVAEVIRQACS